MTERDRLREAARLVLEAYDKPGGDKESMWASVTVLRAVLGDDKPPPAPDMLHLDGFWPGVAVSSGHFPVTTARVRHRPDFIHHDFLCSSEHTEDYAAALAEGRVVGWIKASDPAVMHRLSVIQWMIWYSRTSPTSWVMLRVRSATAEDVERVAKIHRRIADWPLPQG